MTGHLKNVALVGASGNLGSKTFDILLNSGRHNLTIITRSSSTASPSNYPSQVKVKAGDYNDLDFVESALKGQDVVVIMLGFAGMAAQDPIIEAAGKAGVKYVLPVEYGHPSGDERTVKAIPIIQDKRNAHDKIESLNMKWIAVISSLWIDFGLGYGAFDISIPKQKATLYTDSAPFVVSTIAKVAAAIGALLALPESEIEKDFANNYVYVSSFVLTQPDLFKAVLNATGTKETDWQVEKSTTEDLVKKGRDMVEAGDGRGNGHLLFGVAYQSGMGCDFSDKVHNERFGLATEDLQEVVKAIVKAA